jgi:hypothetical protein
MRCHCAIASAILWRQIQRSKRSRKPHSIYTVPSNLVELNLVALFSGRLKFCVKKRGHDESPFTLASSSTYAPLGA